MTCDHTAGVTVRSELVYHLDDLSGLDAHRYILDVQSVTCRGCGRPFALAGHPGIALRLEPPRVWPAVVRVDAPSDVPAVSVDDLEFLG